MIVLDEIHSIMSETKFAEQLNYTLHFIKEHQHEIIVIGLSATPEIVVKQNMQLFDYQVIDKELGSKYRADQIECQLWGHADGIL